MKTTTLRLRRVRFKDGRTIEVFRPKPDPCEFPNDYIIGEVEECLAVQSDNTAGFAFICWSKDGASTCQIKTDGSIPSIYVPDFLRNRLLAHQIEKWTIQEIHDRSK